MTVASFFKLLGSFDATLTAEQPTDVVSARMDHHVCTASDCHCDIEVGLALCAAGPVRLVYALDAATVHTTLSWTPSRGSDVVATCSRQRCAVEQDVVSVARFWAVLCLNELEVATVEATPHIFKHVELAK
jgi:hypothetical protein